MLAYRSRIAVSRIFGATWRVKSGTRIVSADALLARAASDACDLLASSTTSTLKHRQATERARRCGGTSGGARGRALDGGQLALTHHLLHRHSKCISPAETGDACGGGHSGGGRHGSGATALYCLRVAAIGIALRACATLRARDIGDFVPAVSGARRLARREKSAITRARQRERPLVGKRRSRSGAATQTERWRIFRKYLSIIALLSSACSR